MSAIIEAGYPYEIAGLVFYVFFIYMTRRAGGPRYALHTRVFTIAAAIGLVGVVPFHYAGKPPVMFVVLLLAAAAIVSAFLDARGAKR